MGMVTLAGGSLRWADGLRGAGKSLVAKLETLAVDWGGVAQVNP